MNLQWVQPQIYLSAHWLSHFEDCYYVSLTQHSCIPFSVGLFEAWYSGQKRTWPTSRSSCRKGSLDRQIQRKKRANHNTIHQPILLCKREKLCHWTEYRCLLVTHTQFMGFVMLLQWDWNGRIVAPRLVTGDRTRIPSLRPREDDRASILLQLAHRDRPSQLRNRISNENLSRISCSPVFISDFPPPIIVEEPISPSDGHLEATGPQTHSSYAFPLLNRLEVTAPVGETNFGILLGSSLKVPSRPPSPASSSHSSQSMEGSPQELVTSEVIARLTQTSTQNTHTLKPILPRATKRYDRRTKMLVF